jgi:hypothetical protein
MPLTYLQMAAQSQDSNFLRRVKMALLQDVNANRIQATPPANDGSLTYLIDRLGRSILADPVTWATYFATLVAEQLIAKTTLLDEAVTTDADLFSAISAVYQKFLPGK